MEEEYTWNQVRGQFSQFMHSFKGLSVMLEMLSQAAEVEAYLAGHTDQRERLEAALNVQRESLIEASQAYQELQEAIGADKHGHSQTKRAQTINMKEHVAACKDRIEAAEEHAARECERIHQSMQEHCANAEMEREIATEQLEVIYAKLEEADKKLAAVKESL